MARNLLRERLASELPAIEGALKRALESLPAPCQPVAAHILGAGGKRLRPFLVILCGRLLGLADQRLNDLAASVELLHAATLLHDDILDNAASRRGKPAAHGIYGSTATILAGDAMLAEGNALAASFGNPEICLCYARATSGTAAGEILEMSSLGDPSLDREHYFRIARGKTGCLIASACALGALAAGASAAHVAACSAYGENLGLAFQIVDDALDFAPESQTGKPRGGDLRERKMTPPLMLYRESLGPEARGAFDEAFAGPGFGEKEAGRIIAATGPFLEDARQWARAPLAEALAALEALPVAPEREILREMAGEAARRRK